MSGMVWLVLCLAVVCGEEQKRRGSAFEEVSQEAQEALRTWGTWIREHDYESVLSEDQTTLLVYPAKKNMRRLQGVFEGTRAWLQGALGDAPKGKDRVTIGGRPLDVGTIVLIHARNQEEYSDAIDVLASEYPYLLESGEGFKCQTGFVTRRPLVGAWLQGACRPENEMINKWARLWLSRRYEQLPYWLELGVGWEAELSVTGRVHSFPNRDEFVWETEHSGFEGDLRRLARKARGKLSVPPEFPRKSYRSDKAAVAWGVAAFLLKHRPDVIPPYFEKLRELRHEGRQGDRTSWTLNPLYEPPLEDQLSALIECAGDDVVKQMNLFFLKPRKYKTRR